MIFSVFGPFLTVFIGPFSTFPIGFLAAQTAPYMGKGTLIFGLKMGHFWPFFGPK